MIETFLVLNTKFIIFTHVHRDCAKRPQHAPNTPAAIESFRYLKSMPAVVGPTIHPRAVNAAPALRHRAAISVALSEPLQDSSFKIQSSSF